MDRRAKGKDAEVGEGALEKGRDENGAGEKGNIMTEKIGGKENSLIKLDIEVRLTA